MGAMVPLQVEAGGAQLRRQLGRAVDADVSTLALGGVVLVGEHPVDLLGEPGRHGRSEVAARLEHSDHLGDRGDVVLDVFEHFGGDHDVEGAVGERQLGGVAAQHALEAIEVDLAGVDHAAERGSGLDDLVLGVVERDHVGAAAGALEHVTAEAGADVEHPVAGREAELVELDRQHLRSVRWRAASRRSGAWPAPRGTARRSAGRTASRSSDRGLADDRRRRSRARSSGSSRPRAIVAARASLSPAGHWSTVSPSAPVTSGSAPPSVATSGVPVHIASMAGRLKPFVEARHDGHLGLGVELDDALVADAGHELDVRGEAVRVDQVHRVAGPRLADDREGDVALGAQLRHRLEQVRQPLERDVGRGGGDQAARPAGDVVERLEQVGVDADGHEPHAVDARRPCRCGCRRSSSG